MNSYITFTCNFITSITQFSTLRKFTFFMGTPNLAPKKHKFDIQKKKIELEMIVII